MSCFHVKIKIDKEDGLPRWLHGKESAYQHRKPIFGFLSSSGSFLDGSDGEESACNAGDLGLTPWVGKMPWRRKWQLIPVFLAEEFQGQRSLVGYSQWGCKRAGHDLATKQKQMRNIA